MNQRTKVLASFVVIGAVLGIGLVAIPMTATADATNKPSEPGCSNQNTGPNSQGAVKSGGICYDADGHVRPPVDRP